jgi:uncharacterized protein YcaQ
LSARDARRAAVVGQLLSAPRPGSIEEVVGGLGEVQLDPTSIVARTEHLVLFSRLGRRFRTEDLERLLWRERRLFEYWVHVVPIEDLPAHRISMRRYPLGGDRGGSRRRRYEAEWLRANAGFRRYVLRELRTRGPLRARDLEDRSAVPWRTGGWNDAHARNVAILLDLMWSKGDVMIVGRDGQQRLWDLAGRSLPLAAAAPPRPEVVRRLVERQLRARGIATPSQVGWLFDGRAPGWEPALRSLEREGIAVPVAIDGHRGTWLAHADVLEASFRPRTVALSPFDDLVSDRARAARLFGFDFRLEIYVPKARRRWGYFVLPILDGDRFVARIDPRFDRASRILHVDAVHVEEGIPMSSAPRVAGAIAELAGWLGASDVTYGPTLPAGWRRALLA